MSVRRMLPRERETSPSVSKYLSIRETASRTVPRCAASCSCVSFSSSPPAYSLSLSRSAASLASNFLLRTSSSTHMTCEKRSAISCAVNAPTAALSSESALYTSAGIRQTRVSASADTNRVNETPRRAQEALKRQTSPAFSLYSVISFPSSERV